MSNELDSKLIETLKTNALAYSLKTNTTTDVEAVRSLFTKIYALKEYDAANLKIELLASPLECQKRANVLCNTEKEFYSDISHNSLSHATNSYKYLKESGAKFDEKLNDIAESFDVYYYAIALEGDKSKGEASVVLVAEYPSEIHVNKDHKFHNMNGPALAFANGEKYYYMSGIEVEAALAETKAEDFTAELFTKIQNADVRRDVAEKIGNDRLMTLVKAVCLEEFDEYAFLSFELGDGRKRNYMKMICPSSKKVHYIGAQPDSKDLRDALARSFGQPEYKRPLIEDGFVNNTTVELLVGDTLYRHGDVHLKRVGAPFAKVATDVNVPRTTVLHKGNNHNHELIGEWSLNGTNLLVETDSVLAHPEHGEIPVPAGSYSLFIHLEYDHWENESRQVQD